MKYCSKCTSQYPVEMNYCLIDGEPLVSNDPDAITLKGGGPRRLKSILITGESFRKIINLTMEKPYSIVHPGFFAVFLLKGMQSGNDNGPTAHIAIYGNNNFHAGHRITKIDQNEYVMRLPKDFTESDCVFSFTVGNGYCQLFRVLAETIDLNKGKVKLDIELLNTEPLAS